MEVVFFWFYAKMRFTKAVEHSTQEKSPRLWCQNKQWHWEVRALSRYK